jgi:hypothetical protein
MVRFIFAARRDPLVSYLGLPDSLRSGSHDVRMEAVLRARDPSNCRIVRLIWMFPLIPGTRSETLAFDRFGAGFLNFVV